MVMSVHPIGRALRTERCKALHGVANCTALLAHDIPDLSAALSNEFTARSYRLTGSLNGSNSPQYGASCCGCLSRAIFWFTHS